MNILRSDFAFSARLFAERATAQFTESNGVDCLGYTAQSTWALQFASHEAEKLGAKVFVDPAGNHYAVFEPQAAADKLQPALLMGSHVDAVPGGGQADGMMGVIAALQAMDILKRYAVPLTQPVAIPMFVNEESSRWVFALSSKIAMGALPPSVLDKRDEILGQTPLEAMAAQGLDVEAIKDKVQRRVRLIPKEAGFFLEVHIEQEDTLADAGLSLGIVTKAFGNYRSGFVRFEGQADHTGTRPMDKRRDAVLAASHFNVRLEQRILALNETHGHLGKVVIAFTNSRTKGGAQNIVSANNEVQFDIRSDSAEMLHEARRISEELATEIAAERKVKVFINRDNPTLQAPVEMDAELRCGVAEAAKRLGIRHRNMASGAGHDSVVTQENGLPSGTLLTAHRDGSHHSRERFTVNEGDDPYAMDGGYASAVRILMDYASGKVITRRLAGPELVNRRSFTEALVAAGARPFQLAA